MARAWNPNPGSLDYWRSDNPCLVLLQLMGDDEPPPPETPPLGPWSRFRKDSGPMKLHITDGTSPDSSSFETNIGVATTGLAPSQNFGDGTGHPTTSDSGLIFNGSSWVAGTHAEGFGINFGDYLMEREGLTTNGGMGTWSFANTSGFTVCGWCTFSATTVNVANYRRIVGVRRAIALTDGGWGVSMRMSDQSLRWEFVDANSTLRVVDTIGNPNNPVPDEPFFFACQISRDRDNEQGIAYNTCAGSGVMSIWIGTHQSGLIHTTRESFSSANICGKGPRAVDYISFGSTGDAVDGVSSISHLPPDSIIDSIAVLNDAPSTSGLEVLRLNGWNHVPATSDVEHSSFAPVLPGTEDLIGYWDWIDEYTSSDDQSFVLLNKAPATSGILPIDFISPRQGGGAGATFSDADNDADPLVPFSDKSMIPNETTTVGGQISNTNLSDLGVFIPGGSGINHLFPEVNPGKEGWTWIFWAQNAVEMGWQHKTITDNNTKFVENRGDSSNLENPGLYNVNYRGSGVEDASVMYTPAATTNNRNLRKIPIDEWHLKAIVWQTDAPMVYSFHDGNTLEFAGQRVSPLSGFSKEGHVEDPDASVFRIRNTSPLSATTSQWGPVAIYNRILSVAEMSGWALSGVDTVAIESPLSTNLKQTLGYWPLDGFTVYDPTAVSGSRSNDESWYRHHLTNISGGFSFDADSLNTRIASQALQVDVSGSMVSLEKIFTGANLDLSNTRVVGSSGFAMGCWMHLPSGDLETQGNGSSGLFGEHMFMGCWDQDIDSRSWFLGLVENKIRGRVVLDDGTVRQLSTDFTPRFNDKFFVGMDVQPSGSVLNARIFYGEEFSDDVLTAIHDSTFGDSADVLQAVGASGFSLLNAPNLQFGFPSGTRMNNPFIYAGAPIVEDWVGIKQAGINRVTLGSGSVSTTDPENISHWKFDDQASRFLDFGREQNFVFPINQDGNNPGLIGAIHTSGVVIRRPEYYDTLPINPQSRRLDLGSGNQSWTFVSWVFPPTVSLTDRHYIMAKGGDEISGIQIFTPSDSLRATTNASGVISASENGNLAPNEWNHLAVVFDRDNNEFTTIMNGRYAGTTFDTLIEVPVNNSGMALGGRGDAGLIALPGGSAFSGYLDDTTIWSRALTLPEISGLAANSFNYNDGSTEFTGGPIGAYISGIPQFLISGLIGSFLHGSAQDIELIGGYVSGVEGLCIPYGGFIHGKAFASGQIGAFLHGSQQASGVFGHFVHGLDSTSGFIGHYEFGACEANGEFDIVLNFSVITNKDFDARLGVEKTQFIDFDARLGVIRITQPPTCTFEAPLVGELASGVPFTLTVQGSGIAQDGKDIATTRFTFADFKGAEQGTLVSGVANSGLFQAQRGFDTAGWFTLKIEVLDSFGYRASCCRPFLLLPEGSTSGEFINGLPGISIESSTNTGSTINTVSFTHSISGLETTSGLLEYSDFADQQESLVNSLEMPVGTQFTDFVRRHDFTYPGKFCVVWSVSGSFGIVSDTIADGIDYIV